MRWMNNLPVWAWSAFTFVLVYCTWNPTGYSLFDYVAYSHGSWPSRTLTAVLMLAIFSLYLHETYQTFNMIGAMLFVMIIAATVWQAVDWGLMRATSTSVWQWLAPAIFSLLLSVGLQGGRIYRSMTGRVPVSVDSHSDYQHHDATPTHHG